MSRQWTPADTAYFLPLLIERDGKKCFYCERQVYLKNEILENPRSTRERQLAAARRPRKATIDHRTPISKGGSEFDIANMVVACMACNQQKRDRFAASFQHVKKKHGHD
jgi:5-methylcytosine-specific restriction endonuclease McrA